MRVFLTGATGYIGSSVAEALQAAGHSVAGLARSDKARQKLEAAGVEAVISDLRDPRGIYQAARNADGVIHTAATNEPDAAAADKQSIEAILEALQGSNKAFIYTSGVWVYGNTGDNVADEDTPLRPVALVSWRPSHEKIVVDAASRDVRSIVIRPAMVYGRNGGLFTMFFDSAKKTGAVRFIGDGENRWALVHVSDLADLYVRALERAPSGTILTAASGRSVRVRDIAEAASRSAGMPNRVESWPLEQARVTLGGLADALVLDQQVSADKAKNLLKWSPKAPSLFEELEHGSYAARN